LATGFGLSNTFPQDRTVDVYQFQDTVSWTLGNHSTRFGADIRLQKVNNFFLPNLYGSYQFRATAANCLTVVPPGTNCTLPVGQFFNYGGPTGTTGTPRTTATAFENFVLGRPTNISFALGNPRIKTDQNDFFFFFQDDWRVRPTLTLNLGLRYEISTRPSARPRSCRLTRTTSRRASVSRGRPTSTSSASGSPMAAR